MRVRQIMDELAALGGLTPAHHSLIAELIATCLTGFQTVAKDEAAEKRRAYDRERMRLKRSADVCGQSADVGEKERPPDPQKKTNPQIASLSTPKRGHRLPEDWVPTDALKAKARAELGLSDSEISFETAAFCDFFWSAAGANAVKRCWDRAWMNWLRGYIRRGRRKDGAYKSNVVAGSFRKYLPPEPVRDISAEEKAANLRKLMKARPMP